MEVPGASPVFSGLEQNVDRINDDIAANEANVHAATRLNDKSIGWYCFARPPDHP